MTSRSCSGGSLVLFRKLTKLWLIVLALNLSSCGSKSDDSPQPSSGDVRPQPDVLAGDVRWLPMEDKGCLDSGAAVSSLSSATIYEWNGSETQPKSVSLNAYRGSDSEFATGNILAGVIKYESSRKCTLSRNGERVCDDSKLNSDKLEAMKICRSNGLYGRHTLEGMTLTSTYYTEMAYNFYDKIPNRLSGISKSFLLIQPKISYDITKADGSSVTRIDSDNAAFTEIPKKGNSPEMGLFIVYPTSSKAFTKTGLNLWEVPFVMHHEFGHHVFHYYVKEPAKATGLTVGKHFDISSIMKWHDKPRRQSFALATGDDIAQQALDGINETFADLYGYFAGNSSKNQLKGVECLDISRDPSSKQTKSGTLKGLTSARINIYEGRESPVSTKDCYEPAFDDEHDIATALGQPLASFMEQATPGSSGNERAKLLLSWAEGIQLALTRGTSTINIDSLVRELIRSAATTPNFASACAELKPLITGLPLSTQACSQ